MMTMMCYLDYITSLSCLAKNINKICLDEMSCWKEEEEEEEINKKRKTGQINITIS